MSNLPTYDEFTLPLMKVLADHPQGIRAGEAYGAVADRVGLTQEQRNVLLPSAKQRMYKNRIGWAHDRLKRAGLSEAPSYGVWRLTDDGRAYLAKFANGIPDEELQRLSKAWKNEVDPKGNVLVEGSVSEASPYERIEAAVAQINESVSRELLELIGNSSPQFFEDVVLDVLHRMGYGGSRTDLERVGGSGDGGIDGIISLDRLGLEKVYVQAKRWSGSVGRPEIQGFFGALAGKRAKKGVFITTSTFTANAQEYAESVSDSIVLIDGERLAELMIEFEVGVTAQRMVKIARVDTDYFETT